MLPPHLPQDPHLPGKSTHAGPFRNLPRGHACWRRAGERSLFTHCDPVTAQLFSQMPPSPRFCKGDRRPGGDPGACLGVNTTPLAWASAAEAGRGAQEHAGPPRAGSDICTEIGFVLLSKAGAETKPLTARPAARPSESKPEPGPAPGTWRSGLQGLVPEPGNWGDLARTPCPAPPAALLRSRRGFKPQNSEPPTLKSCLRRSRATGIQAGVWGEWQGAGSGLSSARKDQGHRWEPPGNPRGIGDLSPHMARQQPWSPASGQAMEGLASRSRPWARPGHGQGVSP